MRKSPVLRAFLALAASLTCTAGPAQAEIVGALEAPFDYASQISNVQGWVYTTNPGAELIQPFDVRINGKKHHHAEALFGRVSHPVSSSLLLAVGPAFKHVTQHHYQAAIVCRCIEPVLLATSKFQAGRGLQDERHAFKVGMGGDSDVAIASRLVVRGVVQQAQGIQRVIAAIPWQERRVIEYGFRQQRKCRHAERAELAPAVAHRVAKPGGHEGREPSTGEDERLHGD